MSIYIYNGYAFLTSHLENHCHRSISSSSTTLSGYNNRYGYDNKFRANQGRSKRQERVGQLILSNLSQIIHSGLLKGGAEYLDDDLRKRISIVNVNVSPDLRQARVTMSVRRPIDGDAAIDRRQAFSWLVEQAKPLRHTLSQRMSHMKTSAPILTFAQADVSAAVDVMYLIDQIAAGNDKRASVDFMKEFDENAPQGTVDGMSFGDLDEDEEDWIDEDEDGEDDEDEDEDEEGEDEEGEDGEDSIEDKEDEDEDEKDDDVLDIRSL